jgi:hypothetical protein
VAAMPEDKHKMLHALAAKWKADNEGGGRKKPKEAVGVVSKGKDMKALGGGKAVQKSLPVGKGKVKAKAMAKPAAKKKAMSGKIRVCKSMWCEL